jgi:inositol polyphosphate 5-phosphatase INPP5B/F
VLADVNAGADSSVLNDPNALNILDHDAVFWLGDLNYRIDAPPDRVISWIEAADWDALCAADQLSRQMRLVPAFRGFYEAPICFAPTYKVDRYVDKYSRDEVTQALKRTPSYTDRILWRRGLPDAAPASRPDLTVLRYTSAPVYSSDHRPVSATFSMTFFAGDGEEARARAARRMQQREQHRPSIRLSERSLSLGSVRFDRRASTQLVVTNDGHVPVALSFPPQDQFPPWLSLKDEGQRSIAALQPGRSVTVIFRALVTAGTAGAADLASGDSPLEAGLSVQVNRGIGPSEGFEVKGRYAPTCLGASLDQLACGGDGRHSGEHTRRPRSGDPLPCPKEIWWLVDLLWRTREDDEGERDRRRWIDRERFRRLFLASGDLDQVEVVQEHIDLGLAMPAGVDALAVGTCLLNLLRSVEEPVIPIAAYQDAIQVAKKRDAAGVTHLLTRIPSLHGNVFRYIVSLLRELPAVKDGSGVSDIADIFGEVLLVPNRERTCRDLRERALFVRLALAAPEFEPHVAVVDIVKSK